MVDIRQNPTYAQSPWGLENCIFRFTYLWLRNGDNFWFFLTTVGHQRAYGYRFFGGRWNQYSVALRDIVNFHCSPPTPTLYQNTAPDLRKRIVKSYFRSWAFAYSEIVFLILIR